MAILAGYISLTKQPDPEMIRQLSRVFAEYPTEQLQRFACPQGVLLQYDFDAYHQPAWLQNETQFATLIGHPLLTHDRQADLVTLANAAANRPQVLHSCEGVFCLAHFDRLQPKLTVATDPLGLRPFYWMPYQSGYLFSSRLSLFKQLNLPLTTNTDALCELATLGYTLLDHTPYTEVRCAYPGEIITISAEGFHTERYFDWTALANRTVPFEEALCGVDQAFQQVFAKTTQGSERALTTLSGGLDSRLIACEMLRRKMPFKAFNFSQQQSQDLDCAQIFAEQNQIDLEVIQVRDTQAHSVEQKIGHYWRRLAHPDYDSVTRPQLAWSGNGGSVGMGLIYFSDKVYRAAKTQNLETLIHAYLEQQFAYLPQSVVNHARHLQNRLIDNLKQAFAPLRTLPLEKAYQLFLFLNDQHHHLSLPAEHIAEYQMEFFHPFYSWKVLQYPLSQPVEKVRKHAFYHAWLKQSYPNALKSPWQAYPGHLPCPIALENNASSQSQWQFKRRQLVPLSDILSSWLTVIRFSRHNLIKKAPFTLLCLMHLLGVKNALTQLNTAKQFTQW
ncbi:asparagine synthase-related protein [Photobacterium sp. TY1-4]|uniref:asparagine synthase-related protein n=1 Tax=Photobacterium sp. TY1-4 TaxID=2899122 RepID=UPI0021C23577|nr:asparagine synthase-related protein [Photobacterium sp. TY1-4]UXI04330.1 asparagine synthase-related protein [Photobacterium sp. TY1-4]